MAWTANVIEAKVINHDGIEINVEFTDGVNLTADFFRYAAEDLPETGPEIKSYIQADIISRGQEIQKAYELTETINTAIPTLGTINIP